MKSLIVYLFVALSLGATAHAEITKLFSCGDLMELTEQGNLEQTIFGMINSKEELLLTLIENQVLYNYEYSSSVLQVVAEIHEKELTAIPETQRPMILFKFAEDFSKKFPNLPENRQNEIAQKIYVNLHTMAKSKNSVEGFGPNSNTIFEKSLNAIDDTPNIKEQTIELIREDLPDYLKAISSTFYLLKYDNYKNKSDKKWWYFFVVPAVISFYNMATGSVIDGHHQQAYFAVGVQVAAILAYYSVNIYKKLRLNSTIWHFNQSKAQQQFIGMLAKKTGADNAYIKRAINTKEKLKIEAPEFASVSSDVLNKANRIVQKGDNQEVELITNNKVSPEKFSQLSPAQFQEVGQAQWNALVIDYNNTKRLLIDLNPKEILKHFIELSSKFNAKYELQDRIEFKKLLQTNIRTLELQLEKLTETRHRMLEHLETLKNIVSAGQSYLESAEALHEKDSRKIYQMSLLEARLNFLENVNNDFTVIVGEKAKMPKREDFGQWKNFSKYVQTTKDVLEKFQENIPQRAGPEWVGFMESVRDASIVGQAGGPI